MQSTLRCPCSEMLDLSCKLEARSSECLVFLKTNEYIPNLKLGTKILGSKKLISYYATSFHTMPPGFRGIPNQEDVLHCLKILHLIHFQHFPCQNDHVGKIFFNFFSFLPKLSSRPCHQGHCRSDVSLEAFECFFLCYNLYGNYQHLAQQLKSIVRA